MSTSLIDKARIRDSLKAFSSGSLAANATGFLHALGYRSDKTLELEPNTAAGLLELANRADFLNGAKAHADEWQSVDFLFQLTDEEIRSLAKGGFDFDSKADVQSNKLIESYIFFAVELRGDSYPRGVLADITREVNRLFPMPALVLFKHGKALTLSIINRRIHKRDAARDVLEKVTLIKDIRIEEPHRGHVEILFDLAFPQLVTKFDIANFVQLDDAWRKTLDTSELNRRFYKDLANWYFWALQHVEYPKQKGVTDDVNRATNVIRLITRLIFVWFLKERELVPGALFDRNELSEVLKDLSDDKSTFYKAILQNLFFATLNMPMNDPRLPRRFRGKAKGERGYDQHAGISNVYRYEDHFKGGSATALPLFASIPFLNGGLFECLDNDEKEEGKKWKQTRLEGLIDGFSELPENPLTIPNRIFFCDEHDTLDDGIDLNETFGTKNKRFKVRGLIDTLDHYKFTIAENTPIEEEVALDPELLGKVFENLLASYNPETGATARKVTGSFYTPREIVDYMVDESLIVYLRTQIIASKVNVQDDSNLDSRLRQLFAYTDEHHEFSEDEVEGLISAIDAVKILDLACGSGAFPMGVLHKLVFVLQKLDVSGESWRERQRQRAIAETEEAFHIGTQNERDERLKKISDVFELNSSDYGRKLFLIENCIYGVDIQPIAIQIAKLRFFVSLIIDQTPHADVDNLGIIPLPNLETKFVAANSLLDLKGQIALRSDEIVALERELKRIRQEHFRARTTRRKRQLRESDRKLREGIGKLIDQLGLVPPDVTQKLIGWNPYDQNASADFFDSEWMFGVKDGFDVVIGNPPYVRADAGGEHAVLRRAIEESKQYETLWERWDLYIPFIERGYKSLKHNGVTTMIVSDAFCHSKYAQKSQDWFLKNSRILRLDFFGKLRIFDAAVRNITYFFQKASGSSNEPERRVHGHAFGDVTLLPTSPQSQLTYRAFFPEDTATRVLSVPVIPLSSICYVSFGCRPNSDERVARGEFVVADLLSKTKDSDHPKPYIEAKDVGRWVYEQRRWLEWGTDRSPSRLARPTFEELYEVPEKIVAADVSGAENRAALDSKGVYHSHTLVSVVPWEHLSGVRNKSLKKSARYRNEKPRRPDLPRREELEEASRRFRAKFLLAVMNSTFARDFLRANRRSNIHLYPDDWKNLPIADVTQQRQTPIVKLVDQILKAKGKNPDVDASNLEHEIDQLVYDLYELTPEERTIIEASAQR